jgi:hypothetical protein
MSWSTKQRPIEERLLEKVIKIPNGCWEFNGARDYNGYGLIRFNTKVTRASRVAYEVWVGEIPSGLCVLHKCDNPCCVNPNHLFIGTLKDNSQDSWNKGRGRAPGIKGERNTVCEKYDYDIVKEVRQLHIEGTSQREISRRFNIPPTSVFNIVRHKSYKGVN